MVIRRSTHDAEADLDAALVSEAVVGDEPRCVEDAAVGAEEELLRLQVRLGRDRLRHISDAAVEADVDFVLFIAVEAAFPAADNLKRVVLGSSGRWLSFLLLGKSDGGSSSV